jgi:hypothetical protein
MEEEFEPIVDVIPEENIIEETDNNITMTLEEIPVEEPIAEPEPEPVVETIPEPESEPVIETIPEPEPEPVVETIPEPEPVIETIPEPVIETIPEPEPVIETIPEPVIETIPEPVVETIPEPVIETIPEPVVETIPEPIIPKLVFIIPYRDREEQKKFYQRHMKTILEDTPESDYKIFFIHQNDKRNFNRGALKNIGFLYVRNLYPNDYKNITIVFNDVDIMPLNKNFIDYKTTRGIIKHFYGFTFTLGGIVSITGADFEAINGFPNFWAWGYEDNALQHRAIRKGIHIDRSRFFPIMDKNFIILHDGTTRVVNKNEFDRYVNSTPEGINSINRLSYTIDETDNTLININTFETGTTSKIESSNKIHNLKDGAKPFGNFVPRRGRGATMSMQL